MICPQCDGFEYKLSTGAASYPSPRDMLDMMAEYNRRAMQTRPNTDKQTEDTDPIVSPIWTRKPERVKVAICVGCEIIMLPRNPLAPHLNCSRVLLRGLAGDSF